MLLISGMQAAHAQRCGPPRCSRRAVWSRSRRRWCARSWCTIRRLGRADRPTVVRGPTGCVGLVEIATAVAIGAWCVTVWWAWIELGDGRALVVRGRRGSGRTSSIAGRVPGARPAPPSPRRRSRSPSGWWGAAAPGRVPLPLARRGHPSRRRRHGGHPARRAAPAVRPGLRVPTLHRAPSRRCDGLLPVFVYTRSGLTAARRRRSTPSTPWTRRRASARFRIVPAAVPHLASGTRIAAGSAVIAAVVGETLIGGDGLGVEFSYAYHQLRLPRAFGAAIVVVVGPSWCSRSPARSSASSTTGGRESVHRHRHHSTPRRPRHANSPARSWPGRSGSWGAPCSSALPLWRVR